MRHTDHDDRHCAHCAARDEADPRDRVAVRVGDLLPPDADPWRAPEGDTCLDGGQWLAVHDEGRPGHTFLELDLPSWQGH